jgi:hypothetical protein
MANPARECVASLVEMLQAETGLQFSLGRIAEGEENVPAYPEAIAIRTVNIAQELLEKTPGIRFPHLQIYCERSVNGLVEKFRSFSGELRMVIEIRHSQDRLELMEERMGMLTEAVTDVLDRSRGDWGGGLFYAGGYEVEYGPVKQGGRNYLQTVKVKAVIEAGKDEEFERG